MFPLINVLQTLLIVRLIDSNDVEFKIQEEVRLDTVVGNLYKTSFLMNNQKGQLTILNSNDKFVKCFKINNLGHLVVARRIDRDIMCEKSSLQPMQKSHISTDEECKIILNIGFPEENMMIRTIITIEDINDNAPTWNQGRIEIKFIDGCKERTKVALPPAQDRDIGQNAQIEYVFKEKDLPFRIDTEDGFYLQTLQSLDREQKESYTFTLVALDKGHPVMSGEIEVFVTIEDLNDNNPIFSKQIYRFKSISEDSPIGTVVGKLEATDADSGINGKFNFKFGETVSDMVKHYFLIQSDGTVTVAAPLDVDNGENELKFKVIVEDEALRPYSRSSDATVIVYINDVNDEKPELKLVFMNLDTKTNKPFVVEHTRTGTLIGILEVRDRDYNNKDVVTCSVDNSQFSLISEDRPVKYKIVTNMEFDREKVTSADLRIICRDSAGNSASSNHSINIKDINDNPPSFTKSYYVIKILENMPINTQLPEKLVATDPDSDSTIQYFILPEYSANFSIDRESGIISTRVSFDREARANYQIKVIAKDAIRDVINTGTCTVQIQILDENDNKPIFTLDFYTFHIPENSAINTVVGTIEATDLDTLDPRNALTYRFDQSSVFRQFKINPRSGVITVMTTLDREKTTHYIFPVSVEDGYEYSSPRYTATSTVTIIVDDVNDNAPKFIIPNATKSSFDVSIKETVGHKIIYIQAVDEDYSDNAKIHYNITAGNELGVFSIDPTNGLLFLSDSLQSPQLKPQPHYILTVTACDYGKPKQLCTNFKNLRIVVHNGDEFGNKLVENPREQDSKDRTSVVHHEAIIICLAIVFITLLISASALICLIKCKPGFWCRRSTRATSKDKRFETGAISQMLPTIDANMKDKEIEETMRNFCSENHQWMMQTDPTKTKIGKFGYAVDHTNRPDYQTLESLCLATSMRNTPQPRFVDPCSRFQTQTPFSHSTSFLSNHDLKIINQLGFNSQTNESLINDGQTHVYQSVDESNPVHFYSKLNETKKSSKYNLNESNIDPNSTNTNNNNNNNIINNNSNNNINNNNINNSNNNNKSSVQPSHSKDKDLSKYATYSFNESSFV